MKINKRGKRLRQLLDMAKAYRGISLRELASLLNRDPGRIIPQSGIPKMDLVTALARVLDWPTEAVIAFIELDGDGEAPPSEAESFEELQTACREAWIKGRYALAVTLGQRAFAAAETADQRALACIREVAAWSGFGHYTKALEVLRRGLAEPSISLELRLILESNLANSYYTGWELVEARGVANELLIWFETHPPESQRDRATQAFAHYVHGHALRRMITTEPVRVQNLLQRAKADMETSGRLYQKLADDFQDESYRGTAHTCEGGIIEVEVELGLRKPMAAMEEIRECLDAVIDPSQCPGGDWLESYGWWCIFGCNIALRCLDDERQLQHYLGVFTEKADQIARQLDNWSLRERVFVMEFTRHERVTRLTGLEVSPVLDGEDVQALVGTMGRFPAFRETGMRLLQSARIVHDN